jgi:hypothetical protein
MPYATCAHCDVAITDHATMVDHAGKSYCCTNCMAAETGQMQGRPGTARCAHCQTPIVDASTQAERNGMTFCCTNCAAAMAARTPRR